ncbi:MAG TPA: hypothetical protein VGQ55_14875 [Pyrinomonadaceae bacterium]|nr:hypothetical protein [Pyrinomonadaceae bacterium]
MIGYAEKVKEEIFSFKIGETESASQTEETIGQTDKQKKEDFVCKDRPTVSGDYR